MRTLEGQVDLARILSELRFWPGQKSRVRSWEAESGEIIIATGLFRWSDGTVRDYVEPRG